MRKNEAFSHHDLRFTIYEFVANLYFPARLPQADGLDLSRPSCKTRIFIEERALAPACFKDEKCGPLLALATAARAGELVRLHW